MRAMKASLIIFVVLLPNNSVRSDDVGDECIYPCTYVHDPVCGADDNQFKYFGSECFMNRHNKCNGSSK